MSLAEELIQVVESKLDKRPGRAEKAATGVFYTAVTLDTGQAGVAFTPVRGSQRRSAVLAPPAECPLLADWLARVHGSFWTMLWTIAPSGSRLA